MRRGSEGVAVAVGELVGGDGCVRASEREEAEEKVAKTVRELTVKFPLYQNDIL